MVIEKHIRITTEKDSKKYEKCTENVAIRNNYSTG